MNLRNALVDLMKKVENDTGLWDIITALRGPDCDSTNHDMYTLKKLTTERIRTFVGLWSPMLNSEQALSPDDIILRNKLLDEKANSHFFIHFVRALCALKANGYPVPDEEMWSPPPPPEGPCKILMMGDNC
jgi:hypothetical protein